MKIEIDTKRDSKDEIKKIIAMLQHLVDDNMSFSSNTNYSNSGLGSSTQNDLPSSTPSTSSYSETPSLGNMFDFGNTTNDTPKETNNDEDDDLELEVF